MESIQPVLAAVSMASIEVRRLSLEQKKSILFRLSQLLIANQEIIIQENKKDLDKMDDSNPKKDRLLLNESRIKDLADSLHDIVKLEDPAGKVLIDNHAENGLHIQKITVPMGVVGVIYEARPNVTIDVAALCLYAGNAVVLRGGSDAEFTNKILVKIIHDTLIENGVDKNAIQLLPVDRKFVKELLEAVKYVDIIIPRGSQQLIDFVRENSKVPTIETGAGVCHTYVESTANLKDAVQIVINAKTQRPSVCNALDTILVDEKIAAEFLPMLTDGLNEFNVTIFADETAFAILKETGYPNLQKATEENFGMEYLSQQCSVKIVSGFDEAVNHIRRYSSRHSEAILSTDDDLCNRFLNEVDAAAVYTNASTRFTDGGCFGLGAEIGISTQKLHARGPFALEKLTTEKWLVRGSGQIR
ncbi:MAG TPA: glutamate-5-semialdehyde dehydrogenase [Chitinophagales bacterium]|jgi:glutamate-5-semialdehyde dehydrogenase|nr:glutamate-5-semialdehyde dehydrogenase [Chitinophagales bacterium]